MKKVIVKENGGQTRLKLNFYKEWWVWHKANTASAEKKKHGGDIIKTWRFFLNNRSWETV